MICGIDSSMEVNRLPILKLLRSHKLAIQILILNRNGPKVSMNRSSHVCTEVMKNVLQLGAMFFILDSISSNLSLCISLSEHTCWYVIPCAEILLNICHWLDCLLVISVIWKNLCWVPLNCRFFYLVCLQKQFLLQASLDGMCGPPTGLSKQCPSLQKLLFSQSHHWQFILLSLKGLKMPS